MPLAQSILFAQALTQAGVPNQLIVVKNGGHGFSPQPGTTIDPSREQIKAAVYAFFDQYLKASN